MSVRRDGARTHRNVFGGRVGEDIQQRLHLAHLRREHREFALRLQLRAIMHFSTGQLAVRSNLGSVDERVAEVLVDLHFHVLCDCVTAVTQFIMSTSACRQGARTRSALT